MLTCPSHLHVVRGREVEVMVTDKTRKYQLLETSSGAARCMMTAGKLGPQGVHVWLTSALETFNNY